VLSEQAEGAAGGWWLVKGERPEGFASRQRPTAIFGLLSERASCDGIFRFMVALDGSWSAAGAG
jgi:hypothetical protein